MPDVSPKILNQSTNSTNPAQGMGSFGYMQNPVMQGAGMPQALPQQAQGGAFKPLPMYQPKPVTRVPR